MGSNQEKIGIDHIREFGTIIFIYIVIFTSRRLHIFRQKRNPWKNMSYLLRIVHFRVALVLLSCQVHLLYLVKKPYKLKIFGTISNDRYGYQQGNIPSLKM